MFHYVMRLEQTANQEGESRLDAKDPRAETYRVETQIAKGAHFPADESSLRSDRKNDRLGHSSRRFVPGLRMSQHCELSGKLLRQFVPDERSK